MNKNILIRLTALSAALILLLSACTPGGKNSEDTALIWSNWSGYGSFLELAGTSCPDIELKYSSYAGANRTGYSWAQMRADDIPDIFITSQILDEELAMERLVDLSKYDFVNSFSTSLLDQVAVHGGVYLLPVCNNMYGIYYNKTLMEEHGWEVPSNFAELEALCAEIRAAGLLPGVISTQLTGNAFSAVFNLAKTTWLTTPDGIQWERNFLAGDATAAGMWEGTMDYVQKYIDIGMFHTDPDDKDNANMLIDYLGGRKAVFFTASMTSKIVEFPETGDKLGMMPYISRDGDKNIYMYSPSSYIGISQRLTEPGNEEKLEKAVRLLTLLFSPEGQATFLSEDSPCTLSVLDTISVSEDSLIYDARQAMRKGRAFPMTYVGWENVLTEIGQAYKEWFRAENGMDAAGCIARMDELQRDNLTGQGSVYFCESTADFTVAETAELVGKALGSAAGADAAMVAFSESYKNGTAEKCCITGKLYQERINTDVANTICPGYNQEYAIMTMTGAQAKELAQAGFDKLGDGQPFPYLLVMKGGGEPEDDRLYQVAFLQGSYTEEVGRTYGARTEQGSIRSFVKNWLEAEKTVSPDGNPWK